MTQGNGLRLKWLDLGWRIALRLRRELAGVQAWVSGRFRPTFCSGGRPLLAVLDRRRIADAVNAILGMFRSQEMSGDIIRAQAADILVHRFDLLGSGPMGVTYGTRCKGLAEFRYDSGEPICQDASGRWLEGRINRANLKEAKRVWGLVDTGYVPIDWQLDFKSGYRWRESTWHRDIRFGHLPGVDIKVPWELARMQHLPTLALACHFALAGTEGFAPAKTYAREFRNQVLDFIATNPPGFGVNWSCTMDVAIRAANLLFARDLMLTADVRHDDAFEAVFAASMLAHGRHVVANLEWAPRYRGNHYLADIVGLLFIAAYLPGSDETNAWLAFAVQELFVEVGYQFHADGSNFEASVCYHRLSAEMVMWAFALLMNLEPAKLAALKKPQRHPTVPRLRSGVCSMHCIAGIDRETPVPDWCWARLAKMADFTQAMTRPDNMVVQFGDNDSGRFISLGSAEQLRAGGDPGAPDWSLDHGALVAGIHVLTGRATGAASIVDDPGARILRAFAGLDEVPAIAPSSESRDSQTVIIGDDLIWDTLLARFEGMSDHSRWSCSFVAHSRGLLAGLQHSAFAGMGCFVVRSPRLFLAVRCGEIGLAGLGAHAHCDQLAIELIIDGESLVRDPGTRLYTPLAAVRNAYRSARVHHVPRIRGQEPADLTRGLFDLRGAAEGECLYFGSRGFIGRHAGYGAWVYRLIDLADDRIVVRDFADGGLPIMDPTPELVPFSPGYGRILPEQSFAS